jgi:hypothetical protein
MATNQRIVPPLAIGVIPAQWTGTNTLTLNTANTWVAFSFYQQEAKTLNEVRVFFNAKTGTLGANDLTCEIYSILSTGGLGVSLGLSNTLSSPVGTQVFRTFTGFNLALSAGTEYRIVLKNVNGTPASNNVQLSWNKSFNQPTLLGVGGNLSGVGGSNIAETFEVRTTTTGISGFSTSSFNAPAWRLGYSDGSYYGFSQGGEFSLDGVFGSSSGTVFGTRETGVILTTPLSAVWSLRGGAFIISMVGNPVADLRLRLYQGVTLIATSATVPRSLFQTGAATSFVSFYFPSTVTLRPGTQYRLVVGVVSGGDSSNLWKINGYLVDTDANSVPLLPFATPGNPTNYPLGTWFDGSVWAQKTNWMPAFAFLLDTDGEFAPAWPRRPAAMNGGFGG